MPFPDAVFAQHARFDPLVKLAQLWDRMRRPARSPEHRRLVDHHVGNAVLAHAVPIAVGEPAGAHHGSGLVRGPEAENETTPELIAMVREHKLQHTAIAGRVIGCALAVPAVLVATDEDKILAAYRRQLADGHLQLAPAILNLGVQAHTHGPVRQLIKQIAAVDAGDADAGNDRHLGLDGLGRWVPPGGLHRPQRQRRIFGVTPVAHDLGGRTHQRGDALLLVAPGRIG
jgi:hypothetical protein